MRERGITVLEMLVVVSLIGLMAAISFPSVASGLDSIRLATAADDVASTFSSALNYAERRQTAVEIAIDGGKGELRVASARPGLSRVSKLSDGVRVVEPGIRTFYVFPGGAVPRIEVQLINARGARRLVRLDPISGVAEVTRIEGPLRRETAVEAEEFEVEP